MTRRCVGRRKPFATLNGSHPFWHRSRHQRLLLFRPVPLPPLSSEYRLAERLQMTVQQLQATMTCREYVWWIAYTQQQREDDEKARREAERGR